MKTAEELHALNALKFPDREPLPTHSVCTGRPLNPHELSFIIVGRALRKFSGPLMPLHQETTKTLEEFLQDAREAAILMKENDESYMAKNAKDRAMTALCGCWPSPGPNIPALRKVLNEVYEDRT